MGMVHSSETSPRARVETRRAARRPAPRSHRAPAFGFWDAFPTAWFKASLAGLAALVLLMVCGFGSWQILRDEQAGTRATANEPKPTALPRDIGTREADPRPLTSAEVFPGRQLSIDPAQPAYQLIGAQNQVNCKNAADGGIAALVAGLGCSQVVRATLRSPTRDYLVTGGVFNLATTDAAKTAYDRIKQIVDNRQGRFKGYVPTNAAKPLALASTHLGWDYRGHFLVYCVIARADGKDFADGDPYAQQILYDVIEMHLLGTVVQKRSVRPISS
ncbi:hypothetical protein HDA40_004099 [Hamadaea flava]|uniref:Uncharacterized protein n=1 Tax=Hamadaea flava TaxID=1742688 RepID=A0ABV8LJ11_9ACTN|nr:hypothetical protein [Hamadaea flava]MCP2325592.1 hypothetical protein [Hamadaea flava]